ncbi:MAG: SIMPL domain-containing protein [Patescibacteria group bacterium]
MIESRFKNILFIALSLFLFTLMALGTAFFFHLINYSFSGAPAVINVSGQGKVIYQPDLAEINISVITKGGAPDQVQRENDGKVRAIVDYLKEKGVKEEDIKTRYYNLYPEYEQLTPDSPYGGVNPLEIIGYSLNQGLGFKVREIGLAGEILAGLTDKGANNIENISFGLSDEKTEELRSQAKQQAIEKAQAEFQKMKSQFGFKKFRLTGINDLSSYPGAYLEKSALGLGGDSLPASPIQPGTGEVIVNVNLTYKVK